MMDEDEHEVLAFYAKETVQPKMFRLRLKSKIFVPTFPIKFTFPACSPHRVLVVAACLDCRREYYLFNRRSL